MGKEHGEELILLVVMAMANFHNNVVYVLALTTLK